MNKYLEKIAAQSLGKSVGKGAGKGAVVVGGIGAGAGAGAGGVAAGMLGMGVKQTNRYVARAALTGGAKGALLGAGIGGTIGAIKHFARKKKREQEKKANIYLEKIATAIEGCNTMDIDRGDKDIPVTYKDREYNEKFFTRMKLRDA